MDKTNENKYSHINIITIYPRNLHDVKIEFIWIRFLRGDQEFQTNDGFIGKVFGFFIIFTLIEDVFYRQGVWTTLCKYLYFYLMNSFHHVLNDLYSMIWTI